MIPGFPVTLACDFNRFFAFYLSTVVRESMRHDIGR
jgi:hypothetical protein